MELEERLSQVRTREDLVAFISALRADLENHPENWENPSLTRFLEAMAAWISAMDQYRRNQGQPFSEDQPWALFGTMLLAARVYE